MKMIVGLTGKTGSGKTTAAQIFTRLGAFVIDCDEIAHKALFDKDVIKKLLSVFPESICENGEIVRSELGRIVFSNSEKLLILNSIVHPWINSEVLKLCESSYADIVIIDGSELEASGIDKKCKHIIVMESPESLRLERITMRDSISADDAQRRINAQKDYSKKAIVITNDSTQSELEKKIEELYKKLSAEL